MERGGKHKEQEEERQSGERRGKKVEERWTLTLQGAAEPEPR